MTIFLVLQVVALLAQLIYRMTCSVWNIKIEGSIVALNLLCMALFLCTIPFR